MGHEDKSKKDKEENKGKPKGDDDEDDDDTNSGVQSTGCKPCSKKSSGSDNDDEADDRRRFVMNAYDLSSTASNWHMTIITIMVVGISICLQTMYIYFHHR